MKYIFIKKSTGNYIRKIDAQHGILREVADSANVEPASSLVNPNDFELIKEQEQVNIISKEISKLSIKRKLESYGKWDSFKAFLSTVPSIDDEFWLAQSLKTDDPIFTQYSGIIKSQIGLSDEQFNALIND
jgi:hypothetical protein